MELSLIEQINSLTQAYSLKSQAVRLGIGDDTAIIAPQSRRLLLASDMLLEGVHFDYDSTPPHLIGRKALAVNLSDVAAMAGTPLACVVSLAIPKSRSLVWVLEVMKGVLECAAEFNMDVVGGDTNVWSGAFVIDVAILGTEHSKGSVTRGGAKPGNRIFVTGPLGGSIEGKHLTFTPRIAEAAWLRNHFEITAMIDISDGLGKDLRHILKSSGVGAMIERGAIPRSKLKSGDLCTLDQAMNDGEDFELCFTVSASEADQVKTAAKQQGITIYQIGSITAEKIFRFEDGSEVGHFGYEHGQTS